MLKTLSVTCICNFFVCLYFYINPWLTYIVLITKRGIFDKLIGYLILTKSFKIWPSNLLTTITVSVRGVRVILIHIPASSSKAIWLKSVNYSIDLSFNKPSDLRVSLSSYYHFMVF